MSQTNERAFETYVEEILLTRGGWKSGSNAEWDKERALFPAQVFAFLQDTQPKLWAEMQALHAAGLEALLAQHAGQGTGRSRARCMSCGTGSSSTARPFASPTSSLRTALNDEVLELFAQEPADGDAAGAVPSRRQPHAWTWCSR